MLKGNMFFRHAAFFVFIFASSMLFAESRLVFAVSVMRHGDRTPTHDIKASPYSWPQGLGELTPHGMQQEFELGSRFRERYVTQLGLLPEHYAAKSILVRSSDFNRTLTSAECFLLGLYPPGTGPKLSDGNPALPGLFQPIPITTIPLEQDTLLVAKDKYIKRFTELSNEYSSKNPEFISLNENLKKEGLLDRWSGLFKEHIVSAWDLLEIGDSLYVRQMNNVPMPPNIDQADIDRIVETAKVIFAIPFKEKVISAFLVKEFLAKLTDDMKKAADSKQKYKAIFYFGHDTTIAPIMGGIGKPLDRIPPYASSLSFELYKDDGSAEGASAVKPGFYLKIIFNGSLLQMPYSDNQGGYSCSLDEFNKDIAATMAMDFSSWQVK